MAKTLQELRTDREKANDALQALHKESEGDGFAASADFDAKWKTANDGYNAAVAAEQAELTRLERAETAAKAKADADALNARGKNALRSDYQPRETVLTGVSVHIPAQPISHGRLQAFKGPDAAERAHRVGMWALGAIYGVPSAAEWCNRNGIPIVRGSLDGPSATTLSTTSNSNGGYLVPNEASFAVAELALQYGVFRQYAEAQPMSSGTWTGPRRTGAMTAYWVAEGSAGTQSDPTWDLISLVAKDLKAKSKLTTNVDEDSAVNLGDKIAMEMGLAFVYAEDNAGFNGDGTSTYGGIQGLVTKILANTAAYVDAASGNVSDITLDLDDFNKVIAAWRQWPGAQPRWFMHPTVWANSAQRLQMALGGVVPADVQAGAGPMLLGYPVTFANVLDSTPTVSEIAAVFGDLRLSSKFGSRRGQTIEVGRENDDLSKGLITIVGTERVDVVNHTVTDPIDSTKSGPVIGLKLAAS